MTIWFHHGRRHLLRNLNIAGVYLKLSFSLSDTLNIFPTQADNDYIRPESLLAHASAPLFTLARVRKNFGVNLALRTG